MERKFYIKSIYRTNASNEIKISEIFQNQVKLSQSFQNEIKILQKIKKKNKVYDY